MRSILIHAGTWKYVNGDEQIDTKWGPDKIMEWGTNDEKALATIMLSVKDMKDSKYMAEYLNNFCDITEKLADVGIRIQDELLVLILLSSLPKEYENFVVAMETRDSLPALGTLKLKLLEEHERRNQQNGQSTVQQAFSATKSEGGNNNWKNKEAAKVTKGNCFICGKKGHYANKCKTKRDQQKSYSLTAMAKSEQVSSPKTWYIDSGATSHMCAKTYLQN